LFGIPARSDISTIHPTAIVSKEAKLAPDVTVGAYAVIEGAVTIGAGTALHSGARLLGPLTMGERNVVHPNATLGGLPQDRKFGGEHTETLIGDDNIFREGTTVHRATGMNGKTVIGSRCYVMVNAHVGHNCSVADDVTLINGAVLGGHVHIAPRAIIGAYVAVHQFCRVGRLAMLSNSCCMTVDVPPFFTAMETNTLTQLNAVGLRRSGMSRENINAIRKMFQIAFRDNAHRPLAAALAALPPEIIAVPEVQEVIHFCKHTKRGIALFQAWSNREKARPTDSTDE
jgi:UDP-N-acetylglucosamine acyltransferase